MNKYSSRGLCSRILRVQVSRSASPTRWHASVTGPLIWRQYHSLSANTIHNPIRIRNVLGKTTTSSSPNIHERAVPSKPSSIDCFVGTTGLQISTSARFTKSSPVTSYQFDGRRFRGLVTARNAFKRHFHATTRRQNDGAEQKHHDRKNSPTGSREDAQRSAISESANAKDEPLTQGMRTSSRTNLIDRLPQIPHRPTREELLAAATGFWSRLKIRFKWFSIRSARPFNADEIGAFFSWLVLGHVVWIVLGTTTFFSLAILAVNTVFAQETVAGWVGNYLTRSSGIKIVFESAIVPRWGDGVITFKNVFVSRRPGQGKGEVSKGSPATEAAAAAATVQSAVDHGALDEDTNFTQFDLSLDTVNVTLSFN